MRFTTVNYDYYESEHTINDTDVCNYTDLFDESVIGNLPGQPSLSLSLSLYLSISLPEGGRASVELPPRRELMATKD